MKISSCLVFGIAIAGLALPAGSALQASAPAPARYAVEVDIVPDLGRADAFQARAVVTDLESGRALARPLVQLLSGPGGGGQIRTGMSHGMHLGIQVEVDEGGQAAAHQAEIWRGEQRLSAHKVRLRLAGQGVAE